MSRTAAGPKLMRLKGRGTAGARRALADAGLVRVPEDLGDHCYPLV